MSTAKMISTFMTHDMNEDTILALSTGREDELEQILSAIKRSVGEDVNRQHLVIYGERGAGKSYLLKLVQIHLRQWASEKRKDVAFVLLPEEQIGVRSAAQLLRAIRMRFTNEQYIYESDTRPLSTAFGEESDILAKTLDDRFGTTNGLVVAAVENYDMLSQRIFGKQFGKGTKQTSSQREDEERLRKLLGKPDSRLLLLAAATRAVDMDYERPLFKAFEPVELTQWIPDTCIRYFQKRRRFMGLEKMTEVQEARARAVAQFIAGNPRLARLLCDVLEAKDPMSIAGIFDSLSDYLAEYYQAKLQDFSGATSDLLNALIFGGEPCTQTELAERAGLSQSKIATTFSPLVESRVLVAEKALAGRGKLYRVRDRLFVYFYRKRFEVKDRPSTLIRMSELLVTFFTAEEKATLAMKSIRKGDIDEAQLYISLRNKELGLTPGVSTYSAVDDECKILPELFEVAGLDTTEARREIDRFCKDQPAGIVRHWERLREDSANPIEYAGRSVWLSIAFQRCGLTEESEKVLQETVLEVLREGNTSGFLIVSNALASFYYNTERNELKSDAWSLVIANFEPRKSLASYARYLIFRNRFYLSVPCIARRRESELGQNALRKAIDDIRKLIPGIAGDQYSFMLDLDPVKELDSALRLAGDEGWNDSKLWLRIGEAYAKRDEGEFETALRSLESVVDEGHSENATRRILEANVLRVTLLAQLGDTKEAERVLDESVALSPERYSDNKLKIAIALAGIFQELKRPIDAIRVLRKSKPIAASASLASKSNFYKRLFRAIYLEKIDAMVEDVTDAFDCLGKHFAKELRFYAPEILIPLERSLQLNSDLWCEVELEELYFGTTEFGEYFSETLKLDGRGTAFQRFQKLTSFFVSGLKWIDGDQKYVALSQYVWSIARGVHVAPFLRDMAEYFDEHEFSSGDSFFSDLCRTLADFHDAKNKDAFLQRIDPDMRTSIELIFPSELDVSEPDN